MKIRKFLVNIGILDFRIGDKVKPNPRIFKDGFQIIKGQDYAVVRKIEGRIIRVYGLIIPYYKRELVLY